MTAPLPVDLLIFDLDGTIADTRRDLTDAVNHVRAAFGQAPLDVRTVTGYVGDGVDRLLERALPGLSPETLREARSVFDAFYAAHYCDHTRPYPGIPEVLRRFAHKKRAVLTNKAEPFVAPMLERMGLRACFDVVQGARPGLPAKPDPAPVLRLLERCDAPPERTLLIGDGPQDVRAGQAARVHTCAVTYGFRPADELRALAPDFVIDDPLALLSLLC